MTFEFEDEDYKATIQVLKDDIKLYKWYQLRRKYNNWKFKRYLKKHPKVALTVVELIDKIDDFLAFGNKRGKKENDV